MCVDKRPGIKVKTQELSGPNNNPTISLGLSWSCSEEDLPAEFRSEPGAGASAVLSLYGGLKVDQHSYLRTGEPFYWQAL